LRFQNRGEAHYADPTPSNAKSSELDDALAGKIEPGTAAVARGGERLEKLAEAQFEDAKRQAAVRYLLEKVDCELPAPVVQKELDSILHDIVRENQVRGISDDEIKKHENELIGVAHQGAKDRVRSNFLLLRIAEKENLKVTEEDLSRRVLEMAARHGIPFAKLIKDLQRREGFGALGE
jgi:trigger factor